MNSFEIFIIGLCFAVLANTDTGSCCETSPARLQEFMPPFYYSFMTLAFPLNLIIKLMNPSQEITSMTIILETVDPVSRSRYEHNWAKGYVHNFCGMEIYSKVYISLELYSSNGLCAIREVLEGRHEWTLAAGLSDSTYNSSHLCLNVPYSACIIEMDLKNDCLENKSNRSYVTPKRKVPGPKQGSASSTRNNSIARKPTMSYAQKPAQNIPDTLRNTSSTRVTSKPTNKKIKNNKKEHTSVTPKPTQDTSGTIRHTSFTTNRKIFNPSKEIQDISDRIRNISKLVKDDLPNISHIFTSKIFYTPNSTTPYTPKVTQNILDTAISTHNIPDTDTKSVSSHTPKATQNKSDTSNTVDADTKIYITITVILAVSVMALILIVVLTRKCCCIMLNPVRSPQLLANDQSASSPFYLNMLFREECDREIELIEQHHYEEITPQ